MRMARCKGTLVKTIKYRMAVKIIRNNLIFSSEMDILNKNDMESDYHAKKVQCGKLQGL